MRLFNFEKKSNNTNSFKKTGGIVPPNKKCNITSFIKQEVIRGVQLKLNILNLPNCRFGGRDMILIWIKI